MERLFAPRLAAANQKDNHVPSRATLTSGAWQLPTTVRLEAYMTLWTSYQIHSTEGAQYIVV
jgi:hypothetical protein